MEPWFWVGVGGTLPADFRHMKAASAACARVCSELVNTRKTIFKSPDPPKEVEVAVNFV